MVSIFSLSNRGLYNADTQIDNWMQPYGDRYAPGYSSKGHDLIDSPVYP